MLKVLRKMPFQCARAFGSFSGNCRFNAQCDVADEGHNHPQRTNLGRFLYLPQLGESENSASPLIPIPAARAGSASASPVPPSAINPYRGTIYFGMPGGGGFSAKSRAGKYGTSSAAIRPTATASSEPLIGISGEQLCRSIAALQTTKVRNDVILAFSANSCRILRSCWKCEPRSERSVAKPAGSRKGG